ncbi:12399_t:CDS:2, partial [Funneliformis mosseae]
LRLKFKLEKVIFRKAPPSFPIALTNFHLPQMLASSFQLFLEPFIFFLNF